ncbi:hypothetical protein RXV86_15215 [Alisedimentitalea sp. MJ-SS2]|uniref:hypothetical protein n=1 Tax=Aliisedimentitalea sp. MJ-SS2 TaxID=3049795 RepID=UPI00290E31A1|nr:hypothetical protein [Alisedimentitalea sp. MJ-SS2]MDU8928740.1 hypothetical protein [Alisedimentitalea sp. MJ-SS2]
MRIKALLLSIALATPTAALAEFTRIETSEQFNDQVVGRVITFSVGTTLIHADGTTEGSLTKPQEVDYTGTWTWEDGFYCRNLVIDGDETGVICMQVEVDGNNLRLIRDKGEGRAYSATME